MALLALRLPSKERDQGMRDPQKRVNPLSMGNTNKKLTK